MEKNRYIRFDWAAKYMLRNKADFAIFEGLISVLVGEKVTIVELLESESNQEHKDDKFNRVDIKAKNSKGQIILVEILQIRELDILDHLICNESISSVEQTVTSGERLDVQNDVQKLYSIIILYFDQGDDVDFTYRGKTILKGIPTDYFHHLAKKGFDDLHVVAPEDVFPEYFVIRVNEFDQMALSPLEEWLQYLKDEYIKPDTKVPGLVEARDRLEYLRMSAEQRRAYDNYLDNLVRDTDVMKTKLLEARIEGEKLGHAKGVMDVARKMKKSGLSAEQISQYTGISVDQINDLPD